MCQVEDFGAGDFRELLGLPPRVEVRVVGHKDRGSALR